MTQTTQTQRPPIRISKLISRNQGIFISNHHPQCIPWVQHCPACSRGTETTDKQIRKVRFMASHHLNRWKIHLERLVRKSSLELMLLILFKISYFYVCYRLVGSFHTGSTDLVSAPNSCADPPAFCFSKPQLSSLEDDSFTWKGILLPIQRKEK